MTLRQLAASVLAARGTSSCRALRSMRSHGTAFGQTRHKGEKREGLKQALAVLHERRHYADQLRIGFLERQVLAYASLDLSEGATRSSVAAR
jgi:hydroxyacyl-ACP dehydratase HTD2-like protein with hotdog domain